MFYSTPDVMLLILAVFYTGSSSLSASCVGRSR
jgi:hypothetical protein